MEQRDFWFLHIRTFQQVILHLAKAILMLLMLMKGQSAEKQRILVQ